jgi:hypothetical protein
LLFTIITQTTLCQEVSIEGRLKPILDIYFEAGEKYGIDFQEKSFKLEQISIVDDLPASEHSAILEKLRRNDTSEATSIAIHWTAMLDS